MISPHRTITQIRKFKNKYGAGALRGGERVAQFAGSYKGWDDDSELRYELRIPCTEAFGNFNLAYTNQRCMGAEVFWGVTGTYVKAMRNYMEGKKRENYTHSTAEKELNLFEHYNVKPGEKQKPPTPEMMIPSNATIAEGIFRNSELASEIYGHHINDMIDRREQLYSIIKAEWDPGNQKLGEEQLFIGPMKTLTQDDLVLTNSTGVGNISIEPKDGPSTLLKQWAEFSRGAAATR